MPTPKTSEVPADTALTEQLRHDIETLARERDDAFRALQEREAELARIQRIGKVGGVEVDFRDGFKNSPLARISHHPRPAARRVERDATRTGSIASIPTIASRR